MRADAASTLSQADRSRLVAILSRMTSPHDGEIVACGRAFHRTLSSLGLRVEDVIAPPALPAPPGPEPGAPLDTLQELRFVADRIDQLSDWEAGFVATLLSWRGRLSARQQNIVRKIAARLRQRAAA